jgi:hypothetical protein
MRMRTRSRNRAINIAAITNYAETNRLESSDSALQLRYHPPMIEAIPLLVTMQGCVSSRDRAGINSSVEINSFDDLRLYLRICSEFPSRGFPLSRAIRHRRAHNRDRVIKG